MYCTEFGWTCQSVRAPPLKSTIVRCESSAANSLMTFASPAPCRPFPVGSVARQFFFVITSTPSKTQFPVCNDRSRGTILPPMDGSGDLGNLVAAFFEGREDIIANPYPLYTRLRAAPPVFKHQHMYLVLRHDDVAALIRDERLGSRDHNRVPSALALVDDPADRAVVQEWGDFLITFLAGTDEPDHMRRRMFQQHGFLPKQLDDVKQYTQDTMDGLLGRAAAKGSFDFFEEVAHVLPSQVIAHMLGVPEQDMDRVRDWTGAAGYVMGLGYQRVPEVREQLDASRQYVVDHIERRRGGPHRDDLLGILLAAEEQGDKLTPAELTVTFSILILSVH